MICGDPVSCTTDIIIYDDHHNNAIIIVDTPHTDMMLDLQI